jgi:hypothetical protein
LEVDSLGFFTRLLIPRSVRRAAHPGRAVKRAITPKAVNLGGAVIANDGDGGGPWIVHTSTSGVVNIAGLMRAQLLAFTLPTNAGSHGTNKYKLSRIFQFAYRVKRGRAAEDEGSHAISEGDK